MENHFSVTGSTRFFIVPYCNQFGFLLALHHGYVIQCMPRVIYLKSSFVTKHYVILQCDNFSDIKKLYYIIQQKRVGLPIACKTRTTLSQISLFHMSTICESRSFSSSLNLINFPNSPSLNNVQ